jgi:hypothetical protein
VRRQPVCKRLNRKTISRLSFFGGFMKRMGKSFILVPLALILLCGACSHAPNDQQIVSSIQAGLYQNPDLKALSVNVTSDHGVVTLSGAVNAPLERLAIEDLAQKAPGVKRVIDRITVAPSSASSQPTASADAPAAATSDISEQAAPAFRSTHHRRQKRHAEQYADASAPPTSNQDEEPSTPSEPPTSSSKMAAASQAAPVQAQQPAPPPPQPVRVTIPSGTVVTVRMIDPVSSQTAQAGQVFAASVFSPVVVGNRVVVPQGADAKVRVVQVRSAGHYQGQSELKLELVAVNVNGEDQPVQSGYYDKLGASRGKNSAEKIGGGAGLGALIGALIGHGKGAGIGAAIGAAGGAVTQEVTHGQQVTIPSEARIDFVLRSPVTITLNPEQ